MRGKLNPDGTETLELTLGRVEPSLFDWMDRQKSGGGSGAHQPNVGNVTTIHPQETMAAGNGTAVALNDHVHGADAAAPAGAGYSGAAIVGWEGDSTKFVHSNHEHPLLDAVTPADIAAAAATGSDNHVPRRDHVHKCARYNHTHSGTTGDDTHNHALKFNFVDLSTWQHCHDSGTLYVVVGGVTYSVQGWVSSNVAIEQCVIKLAGFGGYGGFSGSSTANTESDTHNHSFTTGAPS